MIRFNLTYHCGAIDDLYQKMRVSMKVACAQKELVVTSFSSAWCTARAEGVKTGAPLIWATIAAGFSCSGDSTLPIPQCHDAALTN